MVKLKTYLFATRPWSFSMTFISVTVGSLFGLYEDAFHWLLYVVVLLGTVFAHGATNLMNDYFDVKHGLDQPGSPTSQYRPHPLVEGSLKGRTVFTAAALLYALAFAAGIYLATVRGWTIAVLAVVGALAGYFYTADPVKYKYLALGEFSVFLMWGPLMVGGSFYVQTGSWVRMPQVILASIPLGLWVALVLFANNLKDIDFDREKSVRTLGTLLGRRRGLLLFTILLSVIYVAGATEAALGILPLWSLLCLVSIPLALRLILTLRRAEEIPPDADPKTSQVGMIYGLLLILSLILGHIIAG
jgi:1,4-dihydroxy-2-naphthoate octaprenyltransferase